MRQLLECSMLTGTANAFKDGKIAERGSLKQKNMNKN